MKTKSYEIAVDALRKIFTTTDSLTAKKRAERALNKIRKATVIRRDNTHGREL